MQRTPIFLLSAVCAAALVACGGGGDGGTSAPTASLSGAVADGYLEGAKVCLDLNSNSVCDAGEPFGASGADGKYTISGITAGQESQFPIVVEVPATAHDSDDAPGVTVGQAYVLTAPAGKGSFVSPLTSLVHREMQEDGSLTSTTAADKIKTDTGLTVDLFKDYVKEKTSASNDDAAKTAYATAHSAAKVLVNSLKLNAAELDGEVATGDKKALQGQLLLLAKHALMSQGASPDPAKKVGVEDKNTLRAALAAKIASQAAATQDVSIQFDLMNGATAVRCGESITLNHILYDHTTKLALNPEQPQSTVGKMVDTRFYISNVMLIDATGKTTPVYMTENANQAKNLALLNFGYDSTGVGTACTASYNTAVVGKVKPGTYVGISMTMGVPVRSADMTTKMNHADPANAVTTPAPLQNTAMNWAWQSGRKFMKVEFRPDTPITTTAGTTPKWNVHIGSTGCAGDPTTGKETACTNANRLALNFASFNAASQKIVLDLATLFAKSDVTFEGGGAVGCMSGTTDPECPATFKALGLGLTGANAGRTLTGADVQTVFKVQ